MTHAAGKSAGPLDHVTHVGVICGRGMLTSAQRASLGRQLQRIGEEHRGHLLILHHGCGRDGDEVAHRAVRVLGGWRIQGHPASELPEGEVLLRAEAVRGLNRIHESKPPSQRDADIVDASEILIVVMERGPQPELEAAARRAEEASRSVIYLGGSAGNAYKRPAPKPDPASKSFYTSPVRKDAAWAARRGREDSVIGKPCPKYTKFLSTYGLHESDASLRLWHAYRAEVQRARSNMPAPQPKKKHPQASGRTRKAAQTPRVKGGLSPKNAALLMKLNQQDTLVDMWR